MPAATLATPMKRVLTETTSARRNIAASPQSAKKRKLNQTPLKAPANAPNLIGSSQPKSQFEEDLEKLGENIQGLKGANSEKDQLWARPKLDDFDPESDDLCFQQIDAEEGTLHGGKATVKLYGVTQTGHSVLLHVTDFVHYLYVPAPMSFTQADCQPFKAYLETQIAQHQPAIHSVQMVMRENIYGFQGNQKSPYLKISVTDPKFINRLRTTIESGNANYKGLWKAADGSILTFDNLQYVLRFMVDCKVAGMSWVEAKAGKYHMIPHRDRHSTCQIEAYVHYRDLIAHQAVGDWAKMAPLRILSFDIECAGRKGIFPEPNVDPVIQIANVVTIAGEEKSFVRNVFCLDTCALIVNAQVLEYDSEEKMLMAWRDFLEEVDPDVIIGYNIANFDFPYLLDRAKHLKCGRFPYWTRLKNTMSQAKETNFSSKQMGNRDTKATNTNGRIQLDLLQLVQRDYQLRSYTLNSVCAHFLGEQKEDVHHTMITELFNGDANSRRRLAVYCLKDAYLPMRLLDKLMCLVNYTEMARVTGVPFSYLLSRGQQVKFLSQLYRKALEQQLVIPNLRSESSDDQYEGATVIEPTRGYYDVPIATLDFASLYPSVIQAHNLCYTTLLNKSAVEKMNLKKDEDYIVTPNGDLFCTAKVRKGLLSQIFEELLGARKQAKKEMASEKDPFKKAVLNGRQLALKVSANSVYGLTGATNGKLPCLAIASSTTSYGRQMIEKTKDAVEKHYTIANGYSHDAQVIYGDTDSVMIKFGPKELEKAMELGEEAAGFATSQFMKPIKLEFEKVYFPYLLINKKRYAGLYWTNPNKWDKMDTKGIETVRRDNCRLVQTVIETSLRMLLIDRDVNGAQEFVKETISDLLQNKIDMSNLVITKALAKTDYAAKQAHVELAERMKKRDAGSAPALGDRVAYVIVKGAADSKNYEKSEDPIYVLENNLPIDTKYYLDNQLAKPLGRIFEPILGEKKAAQLLTGEHTRSISVAAPTMGGLMKFAKKTATCMGCKKPLMSAEERNGAVCENCRPRFGELYQKTLSKVSDLEVRFARLWTQCQRCQGSMHNEVICSSRDCPIFYMRMKAKKDVEDAGKELVRFDRDAVVWLLLNCSDPQHRPSTVPPSLPPHRRHGECYEKLGVGKLHQARRPHPRCALQLRRRGAEGHQQREAVEGGRELLQARADQRGGDAEDGDARAVGRVDRGDGHHAGVRAGRHVRGDGRDAAAGGGHGDAGERAGRGERVPGAVPGAVARGGPGRERGRLVPQPPGLRLLAVGHRRRHPGHPADLRRPLPGRRHRPGPHRVGRQGRDRRLPHLPRGLQARVGGGGGGWWWQQRRRRVPDDPARQDRGLRRALGPLLRAGGVALQEHAGQPHPGEPVEQVLGGHAEQLAAADQPRLRHQPDRRPRPQDQRGRAGQDGLRHGHGGQAEERARQHGRGRAPGEAGSRELQDRPGGEDGAAGRGGQGEGVCGQAARDGDRGGGSGRRRYGDEGVNGSAGRAGLGDGRGALIFPGNERRIHFDCKIFALLCMAWPGVRDGMGFAGFISENGR